MTALRSFLHPPNQWLKGREDGGESAEHASGDLTLGIGYNTVVF